MMFTLANLERVAVPHLSFVYTLCTYDFSMVGARDMMAKQLTIPPAEAQRDQKTSGRRGTTWQREIVKTLYKAGCTQGQCKAISGLMTLEAFL